MMVLVVVVVVLVVIVVVVVVVVVNVVVIIVVVVIVVVAVMVMVFMVVVVVLVVVTQHCPPRQRSNVRTFHHVKSMEFWQESFVILYPYRPYMFFYVKKTRKVNLNSFSFY